MDFTRLDAIQGGGIGRLKRGYVELAKALACRTQASA
jgi:hypothetical protein